LTEIEIWIIYSDIQNVTSGLDPSFPSGHTSMAFSLATSVSLAYPKWYVIFPSYLWAGAVGYSRMDLGVHYPSDVLFGAALGAGSAYLCHIIINLKLMHKKPIFQSK
jgi:membrane-associated phospholipid phosphatase